MSLTATAPVAPALLSFRDVLRVDVIRRVWYAQLVSLFGDFLALYAVIAVVTFQMHGTATQLTGVQIWYMLPIVIVGPLAGVFVDRWPLKPTLVASDLIRAALALLLMFSTEIWHFYVVLAALSVVSSFFGPAQSVTIRTHVPANGLVSANSLMQIGFFGARIVGPAAAGALVAAFGPVSCYAVDVLSFTVSASLIGTVAIHRPVADVVSTRPSHPVRALLRDLSQGTLFIARHAAICFVVLAMAAGLFIIGCFGPLIAIHVRETLRETERTFGFVSGTIGIGLLAGTQVLRKVAPRIKGETLVLLGLAGIGAGVLLLAEVPRLTATFAAAFAIGFAISAIIVPAQVLIQQETPQAMLGRVSSTMSSAVFLGQVLGLLMSGVLVERLGIRAVFLFCSGLAWVLMAGGKLVLSATDSSRVDR